MLSLETRVVWALSSRQFIVVSFRRAARQEAAAWHYGIWDVAAADLIACDFWEIAGDDDALYKIRNCSESAAAILAGCRDPLHRLAAGMVVAREGCAGWGEVKLLARGRHRELFGPAGRNKHRAAAWESIGQKAAAMRRRAIDRENAAAARLLAEARRMTEAQAGRKPKAPRCWKTAVL